MQCGIGPCGEGLNVCVLLKITPACNRGNPFPPGGCQLSSTFGFIYVAERTFLGDVE